MLAVDAPAFRFAVESKPASARQYADAADQMSHGHLSLRFEPSELPASAGGPIAELAVSSAELAASSGASGVRQKYGARTSASSARAKLAGLLQRREDKRAARTTSLVSASLRKQQQQEQQQHQQQHQQARGQEAAGEESADERAGRLAAMRTRPRAELAGQALLKPVAAKRAAKALAMAQRTAAQQRAARYAERHEERQADLHADADLPPASAQRPKRRGWDQPPSSDQRLQTLQPTSLPASVVPPPSDQRMVKRRGWDQPPSSDK